ncbi:hypothetical protein [Bradyrhizobium sp. USDA 4350]
MTAGRPRLTPRERRFLALIYPVGTIAMGSAAGEKLYLRGFVKLARFGRYEITPEGAAAIANYPESLWTIGSA